MFKSEPPSNVRNSNRNAFLDSRKLVFQIRKQRNGHLIASPMRVTTANRALTWIERMIKWVLR